MSVIRMPDSEKVVEYIVAYTTKVGWPPSRRELAEHFDIGLDSAQRLIKRAVEDGLIEIGPGARQIRVMKQIRGRGTQL